MLDHLFFEDIMSLQIKYLFKMWSPLTGSILGMTTLSVFLSGFYTFERCKGSPRHTITFHLAYKLILMAHSHCTGLGQGRGNDGSLYYVMYCTHYTGTGTSPVQCEKAKRLDEWQVSSWLRTKCKPTLEFSPNTQS